MRSHADGVWYGCEHQTIRDPRERIEWWQPGRKVPERNHRFDSNIKRIFCRSHNALEQAARRLEPSREGLPPHIHTLDDDRVVHKKYGFSRRLELYELAIEYGPPWDHGTDRRHGERTVHEYGDAAALVLAAHEHVSHPISLFTDEIFSFFKLYKVPSLY